jgi:hypothetical protein
MPDATTCPQHFVCGGSTLRARRRAGQALVLLKWLPIVREVRPH